MSLSTALIPQQRQPCNRKSAQIFARIFEQRYGHWSYMKNRSICRSSIAVVEQQSLGIVRCVNQVGSPLQTQIQAQAQRSAKFLALRRQQLLALHREHYRIYPQSVDLDAFFGEEQQKCDKVSDVCLLNDHFILVKMPAQQPVPADPQRKLGSRLPRCFKCNRGSRVSPILEELEEPQPVDCNSWRAHDDDDDNDDDVEVFTSSTRIIPAQSERQLRVITTPAPKSLQESVIVKQPQRSAPAASLQLQLETLQSPPSPPPPADAYPHPISRGPLHWFLWPFRRRFASRPKAKIAAVHKTYFIRWNKPPDTLWHGYGVERAPVDRVRLRRCRSAIF